MNIKYVNPDRTYNLIFRISRKSFPDTHDEYSFREYILERLKLKKTKLGVMYHEKGRLSMSYWGVDDAEFSRISRLYTKYKQNKRNKLMKLIREIQVKVVA